MEKKITVAMTLKEPRPVAADDLAQVQKSGGKIIEQFGRILKVEIPHANLARLTESATGWKVQEEIVYQVPDTRRTIQDGPGSSGLV